MARIRQETGYLFKTCSKLYEKYGPVVGLKIGKDRIVVLNDLESMRAMLTNDSCDGRPTGPIYEARTWGARRGKYFTCFPERLKNKNKNKNKEVIIKISETL